MRDLNWKVDDLLKLVDDFFKGPLQFLDVKTFLLSLRIISSYTVHLSLFINRILKGGSH